MASNTKQQGQAKVTVADILAQKIRDALDKVWEDNKDDLDQIAKDGGKAAAHGLLGDVGLLSQLISDLALGLLVLDPPVGLAVEAIKQAEDAGGKWAIGSALGYMMGYTAFSMLNPIFLPLQHAVGDALQTEIFDPQTAANLEARGIINEDYGRSEAAGGNLSGEHYDKLVQAAHTRPALGELLAMLNRGDMDEQTVTANLGLLGYTGPAINALLNLRRNLLGPADLALALLRTDITEEQMLAYAKQLGVTPEDMHILVGNTGEPPGIQDMLFMYRRGIIDEARLIRGLRQSRLRDEWNSYVVDSRFVPMSLADATRATVENYITPAEGQQIAEQNGLKPEHWPIVFESWGRPIAHQEMGQLVHRGLATRAQFDQAMRESDLKDKYINDAFLTTQRLLPVFEVVRAIQLGAATLQEGATMLLQQGYTPEATSIVLKTGLHAAASSSKGLTKTQLVALYEDGIVDRKTTITHLEATGLSPTDSEYTLQLADINTHAKQVRAEVAAIRLSYLSGQYDATKAQHELTSLGETPAQAQYNVNLWDKEKARAAKTLSEAQVIKAAKELTIPFETAVHMLEAMGYSPQSAQTLLASNGVLPTTTPA